MRAIMESAFYYIYLLFIIGTGIYLVAKRRDKICYLFFGLACVILGFGDAYHLIPRSVGLFTGTLDNPSEQLAMYLGLGKLETSLTMTAFYLLLYYFIYMRIAKKRNLALDIVVYVLCLSRVVLCLLPQNDWPSNSSNLTMGIIRNIPFTILGIIVIVLSYLHLRKEKAFKLLFLFIILSFGFYLPVVLFAGTYSWVGMLMLPKTICYMIIAIMAIRDLKMTKTTN